MSLAMEVVKHYEGGEFAYLREESLDEGLKRVGDGLFVFLVNEAQDAQDLEEYVGMLGRAEDQIRSLQASLLASHTTP